MNKIILKTLQDNISSLSMIYIFGSFATKNNTSSSDIDIAFLSKTKINNIVRWDIQQTLSIVLKKDVDLIDLSECSEIMKMQIISKGNCIFNKDTTNFEDNTYYKYIDLSELNSSILNDIQDTRSIYG